MAYDKNTTTEDVINGIDLNGKVAVVTGASGGLGAETARALASKGATVILASRDQGKTESKAAELRDLLGTDKISAVQLDLADLDNIRVSAANILAAHKKIDLLINNAGVMASPLTRTVQGLETQFGVNHVGHFLFTNLLLPALKAAAPSRIVILSSGGHKYGGVDLDDLNWESREYNKWLAYGAAKSANALFAVELNNRYASAGVTANAVHPGVIFTDLGRHLTEEDIKQLSGGGSSHLESEDTKEEPKAEPTAEPKKDRSADGPSGFLELKSTEAGAATSVWAAVAPELEGKGGLYLEDCQIGVQVDPPTQSHGYYDYVLDPGTAKSLWQKTEEIIGETF